MKHLTAAALSLLLAIGPVSAAAGVLDATSRTHMSRLATKSGAPAMGYSMVMVMPDGDMSAQRLAGTLAEQGATIWGVRGGVILATLPTARLGTLDDIPGILSATLATPCNTALDHARAVSGADRLHQGLSFQGETLTGRGVITGLADIGFDPHHPAFADEEGDSRVGMFTIIDENAGTVTQHLGPVPSAVVTDNNREYHATHVAGILASGARAHGLQGMAPEATIVAVTSTLTDAGILAGVESVLSYADAMGMPAVVNISLQNPLGPHDGTTPFNLYLADMARQAPICIAAGNTGDKPLTASKRLAAADTLRTSIITPANNVSNNCMLDIWGDDDTPLRLHLAIRDDVTGTLHPLSDAIDADGTSWQVFSPGQQRTGYETEGVLPMFADNFNGAIGVQTELNPLNGRRHMSVMVNTVCKRRNGSQGRYRILVYVTSAPGTGISLFLSDGNAVLDDALLPGFTGGGSDTSVSDLACTPGVIAVGCLDSRDEVPHLTDAGTQELLRFDDVVPGRVSPFSGYGTTHDGRVLPHVTAPGCYVVSALSTPYARANPRQVNLAAGGDGDAWTYLKGTSMATPVVAGTIALWLEAFPGATPAQILQALTTPRQSAHRRIAAADPRYGLGAQLDAAAGLEALATIVSESQGTGTGLADPRAMVEDMAKIYTFDGRYVGRYRVADLDGAPLPPGVYIARGEERAFKFVR